MSGSTNLVLGLANAVIAFAYLAIPAAIWVLLRRHAGLAPATRRLAWLFVAFFLASAALHLAGLVSLWHPVPQLRALLGVGAALIALGTALAVWPYVPRLLAEPSVHRLTQDNAVLAAAVEARTHELEAVRQRFEQALSRSSVTVYTQDLDLRYTWIHNPRLGLGVEDMIGRTDDDLLPAKVARQMTALKQRVLESRTGSSAAFSIPSEAEGTLHVELMVNPTFDAGGTLDGLLCTMIDFTEQRLFEMRLTAMTAQLATAYRRFQIALEHSPITVFEQDTELRYTFIQNPPSQTVPEDYLGKTDLEIFSEADQSRLLPAKRRVIERRARERFEAEISLGGMPMYFDLRLEPKSGHDGTVEGLIGTAVDLTERRRSERQMRLVMRELTHRSKNLLAVIQSMARKTASLSTDVDSFVTDFSARLRAIAAAHDLLVSHSWSGAELGELLRATLAQTLDPASPRIAIEGPPLKLSPDCAQTLGLAFHELSTNAAKYGALSGDEGLVEVGWRIEDGAVRLRWHETGGPPVSPPEHRGFGRVLLERLVGATLNGSVSLDFNPEGLVSEIVFPRENLSAGNGGPEPPGSGPRSAAGRVTAPSLAGS